MAHGDYTGQKKQVLANQFAQEQALAAQSKTLVTQVVREGRDAVTSLFGEKDEEFLAQYREAQQDGDTVEVDSTPPEWEAVQFRASEDLDEVTVGQDRQFNLRSGQVYVAPKWVVTHLDTQGLVRH
jgi:hypothetical protein